MSRRLFAAWCDEGRRSSRVPRLKTVAVGPVVGTDELGGGVRTVCKEREDKGTYQAEREFSAETGCLPLRVYWKR